MTSLRKTCLSGLPSRTLTQHYGFAMASISQVPDSGSTAPTWFREALAAPREHRYTSVSGCRISYWRWGDGDRPGVVLVHGGGAHAGWWDHIAPWLVTEERCVVALDLSGHGDSGHRRAYRLEDWAAEMLAVAEHARLDGPPVLAGHSLGGWSTVVAAATHPEAVGGLILMDCRIIDPVSGEATASRDRRPRPPRIYPTLEEAVGRYRPEPAQEGNLPFVMDHVAVLSARPVDGGWTWKFDQKVLTQRRPGRGALEQVKCRAAIVRGEQGLVTPAITQAMHGALGGRAPVIDVPLAGHHLMLDQPLLLVTALRAVLADWAVLSG
jgi:pimeloyl-ACP methyl ester carboxylesterase